MSIELPQRNDVGVLWTELCQCAQRFGADLHNRQNPAEALLHTIAREIAFNVCIKGNRGCDVGLAV
jgi:hypothetical protein